MGMKPCMQPFQASIYPVRMCACSRLLTSRLCRVSAKTSLPSYIPHAPASIMSLAPR